MLTQEKKIDAIKTRDVAAKTAQRKRIIDSLIASADPYAPPAEDEILRLILVELKGGRASQARRPESE